MKTFKFEPVRWMTRLLAFVTALIGANELVHDTTSVDIIPAGATPYLLAVEALLAVLLGRQVRAKVTALAAPKDADGTRLVPVSTRGPITAPLNPTPVAERYKQLNNLNQQPPLPTPDNW